MTKPFNLFNLFKKFIIEAEKSLKDKLQLNSLKGLQFFDIGCGSGLFSLAAHRLGAIVTSIDYDENSVNCAKYLKEKFFPNDKNWNIQQGSALDKKFLESFGKHDIVYSWGVLHHTGNMYLGFENVLNVIKDKGYLFISIYNDQGASSRRWTWIKKKYTHGSYIIRLILTLYTLIRCWTMPLIRDTLKYGNPFKTWLEYSKNSRGMSAYYDLIDWVGGYPFEVAKPEEVFNFFHNKGFNLIQLKTCAGGLGCNEFVFQKQ